MKHYDFFSLNYIFSEGEDGEDDFEFGDPNKQKKEDDEGGEGGEDGEGEGGDPIELLEGVENETLSGMDEVSLQGLIDSTEGAKGFNENGDMIGEDGAILSSFDDYKDNIKANEEDPTSVEIEGKEYQLNENGEALGEDGEVFKNKEEVDSIFESLKSEDDNSLFGSDDDNNDSEDFSSIANEFDIEQEEGKTIDKETFITKINEKIDSAKQEFKLDKFNPQARKIIEHINKTGDLGSFFNDKTIQSYNEFLSQSPDSQYSAIRNAQLVKAGGMDAEAIQEKIEAELEEKSSREIKDFNDPSIENVNQEISKRVDEIVSLDSVELNKSIEKKSLEIKEERNNIKSFMKSQENFVGLELSDKDKSKFEALIDKGEVDALLEKDPVKAKYYAYMHMRFGDRISKNMKEQLRLSARDGKNKEIDKNLESMHKDKSSFKKNSGGQGQKPDTEKAYASWKSEFD